ncbi:DUF222 domain-containing protein, partial [Arthrobacter deserti]|nr:DUF222 domain-containing protein [Arthrobacter deserti]
TFAAETDTSAAGPRPGQEQGPGAGAGAVTGAEPIDCPAEPTRAQKLLNGLVGACRIALSTDKLPAARGHRPQVMVSINYEDLSGQLGGTGQAFFGGLLSARTVRKIACDADLIPMVLGGKGEVLDVGRAQRLFTPAMRRALVARDGGCAFPGCSIPPNWCEAHHIRFWNRDLGPTSVANGVLLCAFHHHLIHEGGWTAESRDGIPWFIPPAYIDPEQKPLRNRYRQAGSALPAAAVRYGGTPPQAPTR